MLDFLNFFGSMFRKFWDFEVVFSELPVKLMQETRVSEAWMPKVLLHVASMFQKFLGH